MPTGENIDTELELEWQCRHNCCQLISLKGLKNPILNQLYAKNGSFINDYPLYVGSDMENGIWFDGKENWMVGNLSHVDQANQSLEFTKNDEIVDCPEYSTHFEEYSVNLTTSYKNDIYIHCEGEYTIQ